MVADNVSGIQVRAALAGLWTDHEDVLNEIEQLALGFAIAAVQYCEDKGKAFAIKYDKATVVDK